MKEIGISLTILRTIYVPDNFTVEEIEKLSITIWLNFLSIEISSMTLNGKS